MEYVYGRREGTPVRKMSESRRGPPLQTKGNEIFKCFHLLTNCFIYIGPSFKFVLLLSPRSSPRQTYLRAVPIELIYVQVSEIQCLPDRRV
jgi:hypothetical protein